MKSRDTLRVFLAGSPLVGTFLLDALLGICSEGCQCGGDFVEAIVVDDAFPEVDGVIVALLGEAGGVAGSVVEALLFAVLKGGEAFWVSLAGNQLVVAVLFNALLRSGESDCCCEDDVG